MDIFVSPTAAVLARFVCFVAGSVLAVLIVLTVWDEDVLNVEHILTIMTVLGGADHIKSVQASCNALSFIPAFYKHTQVS